MTDFATLKGKYTIENLSAEYGGPGLEIQQKGSEFKILLDRYIAEKPMTVLEVGQWKGSTLWYWLKYAQPGATIIAMDINHSRANPESERWTFRPDVNLIWVTADSGKSETRDHIRMLAPMLDFVFIDGFHKFPTVRTDWEWYGRPAKLCAMHDINFTPDNDVAHLWREIKTQHKTEEYIEVTPVSGCWWGIGIVYPGEPFNAENR